MKSASKKVSYFLASLSLMATTPLLLAGRAFAAPYDLHTTRVSVGGTASAETEGNGASAVNEGRKMSSDGRYVVFSSAATNLVSGDTNAKTDIFLFDRTTHTTTRVSEGGTSGSPVEADNNSLHPSISADGRYIAYDSDATNLVSGDTNAKTDVFLFDRTTHTTTRVSEGGTSGSPVEGDDVSEFPQISDDGTMIVYDSAATTLVTGDTNARYDVFAFKVADHTTTRVSEGGTSGSPVEADDNSYVPSISSDNRYVAYISHATNLTGGSDTNAAFDAFRTDLQTHTTVRVSEAGTSGSPTEGDGDVDSAVISSDGKYVVFSTAATNMITGDTNAKSDIYLSDVANHTLTRISEAGTSGTPVESNGDAYLPEISQNNRYVVYESDATNLVSGDANAHYDIFLFDRTTHVTTRVSEGGMAGSTTEGNGDSVAPSISADGRYVLFSSLATNLVNGDSNAVRDVFVAQTTAIEDNGPNSGDANNDGIQDSTQAKVASFVNSVTSGYTVVQTTNCTAVNSYSAAAESSTHADADYAYPAGLTSFTATGCASGAAEPITVYFFGSYDVASLKLRKFNSVNNTYSEVPGAVLSAVTVGGQSAVKAVYSVTDGGALDQDATANGTIVDPVGIATSVAVATAATAPNTGIGLQSAWAPLGFLGIGCALVGIAQRRRKHFSTKR